MKSATIAVISSLVLSGCLTVRTPTEEVRAISLCNAGITTESSVKVTAKVEERIRDGLSLDTSLKDEIKGMYLGKANVSDQHAVHLYESYVKCVETQIKRRQEERSRNATAS